MMQEKIDRALDLMLNDYKPGAKSRHWQRFFTTETITFLRDKTKLASFRRNSLNDDLEDRASWFSTAAAYRRLAAITGSDWIGAFAETSVGNPRTRRVDGLAINFHEIVLCQYLHTIQNFTSDPSIIVEIGGGYGGLAHKLKRLFRQSHYVSLDLPEALTLQAYYLSQLNPAARFYLFDDFVAGKPIEPERYDFTLLPGWLASNLPDDFADLFINTRSFMEMNADVIEDYFLQIGRCLKTGGMFYNVNRYFKDTVGAPIRFREYPYDDRWALLLSRGSLFQPHVHEMMTVRTVLPLTEFTTSLRSLPEKIQMHAPTSKYSVFEKISLLQLAIKTARRQARA